MDSLRDNSRRTLRTARSCAWAETQTATYETAWRDLARNTQAAVTEYAKEWGVARHEAEDVKTKAPGGARVDGSYAAMSGHAFRPVHVSSAACSASVMRAPGMLP